MTKNNKVVGMTGRQRQVSEKAIKLRTGSLIEAVQQAGRNGIERELERYPRSDNIKNYPASIKKLLERCVSVQEKIDEMEEERDKLDEQARKLIDKHNEAVKTRNEERSSQSRRVVSQLKAMRNELILKITFQDATTQMEDFLSCLPTPETVLKMLSQEGLKLKELPQVDEGVI